MDQFLRKVKLKITGGGSLSINWSDTVEKHELKIGFTVTKDVSGSANTASIKLWNLNEASRNSVGKELDHVELQAGYTPPGGGSNVGVMFKGDIRDVSHTREGPDIITEINCGDGDKALRQAVISKTLPAGTKASEVIEELNKTFSKYGIKKGEWKDVDKLPTFKRPVSMVGPSNREMNHIGRSNGYYWSIQDETLEIIPGDGFIGSVILITPETGMIDVPTITDNGVRVSALLNPAIRPNRPVEIRSDVLSMNAEGGRYRVGACTYSGDNSDGEFKVTLHAESIKGGKVDQGVKLEGKA